MSTAAWTKFGSLALAAWSHHIARTVFSHTAAILEEQRVLLSPHASLHRCFILLEHIDAVIQNISPERRRKIQAAAERGLCRYLSDVDLELERLYDDYYGLCTIYGKFSFFRSHIPGTYFHREILHFEKIVMRFLRDVWKTTAPGDRSINWSIIFDTNMDVDRILQ